MTTLTTYPVLTMHRNDTLSEMVLNSVNALREQYGQLTEGRAKEIAAAVVFDASAAEWYEMVGRLGVDNPELNDLYEALINKDTVQSALIDITGTRTLLDDTSLLRDRGLMGLIYYRPEATF